jgi:hypothetical protein
LNLSCQHLTAENQTKKSGRAAPRIVAVNDEKSFTPRNSRNLNEYDRLSAPNRFGFMSAYLFTKYSFNQLCMAAYLTHLDRDIFSQLEVVRRVQKLISWLQVKKVGHDVPLFFSYG